MSRYMGEGGRASRWGFLGLFQGLVLVLIAAGLFAPAADATVVAGCTIVANPTATVHTNCPGAKLSGANLAGLDLAFATLTNANLKDANLAGADLAGATLSNAALTGANLTEANLAGANLANASLSGAYLGEANLAGANTANANLQALFLATVMPNGQVNSSGSKIKVTPVTASLANGLSEAFTATGTYSNGTALTLTKDVTWSSSNTTVATVSSAGSATAVVPDTPYSAANFPRSATITASAGTVSGSASLSVLTPDLTSIAVTPASPTIDAAGTEQFTATGTYSDGSTNDLTSTAQWSSDTPAAATISQTGLATGVGGGTTNITASVGAITSPADTLTVTGQAAATITFTNPESGAVQGATFTPQATASSGEPVTLTIDAATTSVCSMAADGSVTLTTTGTCTIDASAPADADYQAASAQQTFTVTTPLPPIVNVNVDYPDDPQNPVLPPYAAQCPAQNTIGGGCAIYELDGTVDNQFDASPSTDPNANPSQDTVSYHWQIFYPPAFGNSVLYSAAGITGYHSSLLDIVAGSLPQLAGNSEAGSDIYWRVELTVTVNNIASTTVFFRFSYNSDFSLEVATDCQLTGSFMSIPCSEIAPQLLPATPPT